MELSKALIALLEYLCNDFLVIFIVSLAGAFVKDCSDTLKNSSLISLKRILISSIFCSILMCAIKDVIDIKSYNLSMFMYFFGGLWSYKLLQLFLDWSVVKTFLKNILKQFGGGIGKMISSSIEELNRDDKNDSKKENEKEEENKK